MTRGNQRDEARLKNAKDAAGKGVKKEGSYLLRKEADSTALADKVCRILHSEMRSFINHDDSKSRFI